MSDEKRRDISKNLNVIAAFHKKEEEGKKDEL